MKRMRISRNTWLLALVLIIGAALRFAGVPYGLPYAYRPDEPTMIERALNILKTRDLNPHWFGYPSVMFYLNAFVFGIYYLIGRALGIFHTLADLQPPYVLTMGVGLELTPYVLLLSRSLTALFSTASIVLVYLLGRKLRDDRVGLLSAGLFAVSPTAVATSQNVSPNAFALFFLLLSFLGTVGLYQDGRLRNYILAGIAAGLAVSSKYNAAFILLPFLAAHFVRLRWSGIRNKNLYIALVSSAAAFLLTTPFSVLDPSNFFQGFMIGPVHYAVEGHTGQEGNSLQWYITYLLSMEGLFSVLALLEIIFILYSRLQIGWVLLSFPMVYFAVISQLLIRNQWTILLMLPILMVLAAMFLVDLYDNARKMLIPRVATLGVFSAALLLVLFVPFRNSLAGDIRLNQTDGRETARVWLESNLPPGAHVAEESYTPYLDPKRFSVQGFGLMVDHSPDWYVQNGFEYLVFGQGMYGRFYADPERYKTWIERYDQFFSRFTELKRFVENGYEIRVYKTGVTLPVGYDEVLSK